MAVVRITTEQRREAGGFKVFALIDPDKHGLCTPYRGMRNEVFFLSHFRDNLPGRTVEARSVHWGNRAMGVAFQLGKGAEILSEQGGISDRDGTSDDGGEIWGLEDGERDGTARNGNNDPFHRQTGFQPADNQHGAPTAHAGQIQEKDLAGSILHVAESFGDQLKDLVRNYKQTGDATKLKTLWYLVGNSNTGYCPLPTRLAQFLRIDIAFPADQYEALAVDIRAVWPDIVTANAYSLMLTRDVMVSTGLIVEYRLCRAFLAEALYRLSKVPTPFMTLSKAQVTALVFEAFHTVERIMPRKIQAPPRIQAPLSP
ncbi:hypothetical protein P152DRAFT_456861 [Eremomyces bilateralis CBS 781.70]|uniref:Uncharacterized protein n=1 Tax=Eremomyces bilateralis CBS 781.70 TaxID=1392243 RepID=A0A6G1G9L3_9PEZI|nr:uncharacterized protein P152DRAFT_456861 [Eremomyces bilateralis CBS 781.70]KAF1814591.1 hypothetical protein P152DRAFT_456861 [Eremomyces bilateralis CBS 781.70]